MISVRTAKVHFPKIENLIACKSISVHVEFHLTASSVCTPTITSSGPAILAKVQSCMLMSDIARRLTANNLK